MVIRNRACIWINRTTTEVICDIYRIVKAARIVRIILSNSERANVLTAGRPTYSTGAWNLWPRSLGQAIRQGRSRISILVYTPATWQSSSSEEDERTRPADAARITKDQRDPCTSSRQKKKENPTRCNLSCTICNSYSSFAWLYGALELPSNRKTTSDFTSNY